MHACCVCICELFSLPNRWTNQAEIWYVVSKYPGEHYKPNVGVAIIVVFIVVAIMKLFGLPKTN